VDRMITWVMVLISLEMLWWTMKKDEKVPGEHVPADREKFLYGHHQLHFLERTPEGDRCTELIVADSDSWWRRRLAEEVPLPVGAPRGWFCHHRVNSASSDFMNNKKLFGCALPFTRTYCLHSFNTPQTLPSAGPNSWSHFYFAIKQSSVTFYPRKEKAQN
jgi:hypothetical protein